MINWNHTHYSDKDVDILDTHSWQLYEEFDAEDYICKICGLICFASNAYPITDNITHRLVNLQNGIMLTVMSCNEFTIRNVLL
jgi:hypothetical protein